MCTVKSSVCPVLINSNECISFVKNSLRDDSVQMELSRPLFLLFFAVPTIRTRCQLRIVLYYHHALGGIILISGFGGSGILLIGKVEF